MIKYLVLGGKGNHRLAIFIEIKKIATYVKSTNNRSLGCCLRIFGSYSVVLIKLMFLVLIVYLRLVFLVEIDGI